MDSVEELLEGGRLELLEELEEGLLEEEELELLGRELLEEELGLLEELEEGLLEDELLEELLAVPLEVPLWPAEELAELEVAAEAVSYTHLDVYKRQGIGYCPNQIPSRYQSGSAPKERLWDLLCRAGEARQREPETG